MSTPYSHTSTAELQAINRINMLLEDTGKFKCHIEKHDSRPNTDGNIDLVNDGNQPIARIEVQSKKIPNNQKSYSVPVSSIEFSKQLTIPFILLCVDVDNDTIYWKHIHSLMPEYVALKRQQLTFTIHFLDDDVISQQSIDETYLRWKALCDEYCERVNQYPRVCEELEQISLSTARQEDIVFYQRMIVQANSFFDHDFSGIKNYCFPGTMQFGIAFNAHNPNSIDYVLYRIFYGDTSVLVRLIDSRIDFFERESQLTGSISAFWGQERDDSQAEKYGREIVTRTVEGLLKEKKLPLLGVEVSKEDIFHFIDRYGFLIGATPNEVSYSVPSLLHGLNVVLIEYVYGFAENPVPPSGTFDQIFYNTYCSKSDGVVVDFSRFARWVREYNIQRSATPQSQTLVLVMDNQGDLDRLAKSLELLRNQGIEKIDRSFNTDAPPNNENMRELERYANILVETALSEYTNFVNAYDFHFDKSRFLSQEYSFYINIRPNELLFFTDCSIRCVKNSDGRLPKIELRLVDNHDGFSLSARKIEVNGTEYDIVSTSFGLDRIIRNIFQHDKPLYNLIYYFFSEDLKEHYGIQIGHNY